jgi:hypothetical protein
MLEKLKVHFKDHTGSAWSTNLKVYEPEVVAAFVKNLLDEDTSENGSIVELS